MERWVGRVALVTGASSGLGAGIAETLVRHGMVVVGCGRRVERIQELSSSLSGAKGSLHAIKCDVTKEEEILAMFDEIKTKYGGVDVCINNAGIAPPGCDLLTGNTACWRQMLDTNVLALSICTREAFRSMRERNIDDGQIVNISSIYGHEVCPSPDGFFYSATKFAIRALTEGVRKELRLLKSHIRIAALSVGYAESELFANLRGEAAYKEFCSSFSIMTAKDVGDCIVYTLSAPPHVEVHDVIFNATDLG